MNPVLRAVMMLSCVVRISALSTIELSRARRFGPADFTAVGWPYTPRDMRRLDESEDFNFYSSPRFMTHIDDGATGAVTQVRESSIIPALSRTRHSRPPFPASTRATTNVNTPLFLPQYYDDALLADCDVLDICSSWISHLPKDKKYGRVVGLGMNARELEANGQLTDWVQRDLNREPSLPFEVTKHSHSPLVLMSSPPPVVLLSPLLVVFLSSRPDAPPSLSCRHPVRYRTSPLTPSSTWFRSTTSASQSRSSPR